MTSQLEEFEKSCDVTRQVKVQMKVFNPDGSRATVTEVKLPHYIGVKDAADWVASECCRLARVKSLSDLRRTPDGPGDFRGGESY